MMYRPDIGHFVQATVSEKEEQKEFRGRIINFGTNPNKPSYPSTIIFAQIEVTQPIKGHVQEFEYVEVGPESYDYLVRITESYCKSCKKPIYILQNESADDTSSKYQSCRLCSVSEVWV